MIDFEFMKNTFWIALRGVPVTLSLTFVSLLLAAVPAFFMALAKLYHVRVAEKAVSVYVSFVRGTPLVLQILMVYSLLPSILNSLVKEAGLSFNVFDVPPILYAFAVFTFNSFASLSEVFRSALLTVDAGQLEAGLSIGLSAGETYRRIIIPQALTAALPNLCNVAVGLLKGTSLAFLMTVKDITALAKMEAAYGYNYIESYIDIFLIYILVCSAVQLLFKLAEQHVGRYRRVGKTKGTKKRKETDHASNQKCTEALWG